MDSLSLYFLLSNKTQKVNCSHSAMNVQLAVIYHTLIIELRTRVRVYIGGADNIKGVTVTRVCVCIYVSCVCN